MRSCLLEFAHRVCLLGIWFCLAVSVAGCRDTLNVGNSIHGPGGAWISSFTVTPADPAGLFGQEAATFSVVFANGTAPYTLSLDFGGSAVEANIIDVPALSPYSATVTLVDIQDPLGQDFTARVSVKDSTGFSRRPQTLIFHIGKTRNKPPLLSLSVAGTVLTASASDPDGDDLTLTLDSATGGLLGSPGVQHIASGDSVDFHFRAADVLAGASGTATVTADDGKGGTDTQTSETVSVSPLALPTDGLAATPLATETTTADTVKVIVATGPMASPFQFMTGVSVVFPPGCAYDANSYDYGAPMPGDGDPPGLNPSAAKDQDTVDGIWTLVNPSSGFLGVGDNLLQSDPDLPAPFTGSSAVDFNITPLGGSNAPAGSSGMLFNFNLKFTAAGSYKLGFLLFDEINRTYYQDGIQQIHLWSDLTNSSAQDTVTVTE